MRCTALAVQWCTSNNNNMNPGQIHNFAYVYVTVVYCLFSSCLFIYLFIIYLFIIHSFIHSFIYLLVYLFIYLFNDIHSFPGFIHSFYSFRSNLNGISCMYKLYGRRIRTPHKIVDLSRIQVPARLKGQHPLRGGGGVMRFMPKK